MSKETTFYRKYRPNDFQEVIGQDHIVKVLEGAIKRQSFSHAYLFAGSRGTGKTSVARLLAQELGCSQNDLIEIDGASSRGIGEIRELREAVKSLPFDSPFKVYIIDEVHMLTTEAFNALLKTLEEPPQHVIFVLATTELGKVPETIISRCEVHNFRRPTIAIISQIITKVAKKEKIKLEPGAAETISLSADGSFRDALGLLQKVYAASGDEKITVQEVEELIGALSGKTINQLLLNLLNSDREKVLAIINEAVQTSRNFRLILRSLLWKTRLALLSANAPFLMSKSGEIDEDDKKFLKEITTHPKANYLSAILREFLEAATSMDYAYLPQLPLELAILKIIDELDKR
ncbi:MAG TPA: DNA polymerase III subunit gamma/tau [Candidatus Vogelbacteria bacterium]|nr:DNA polymerase III subunit gamma/tau [Candidatus Vogelbacteria bacterium]